MNTYFISDENNTTWTLNLLMKIGGGNSRSGADVGHSLAHEHRTTK